MMRKTTKSKDPGTPTPGESAETDGSTGLFAHQRLLRPIEILLGLPFYSRIARRGLGPFSDSDVDSSMARTTIETYAAIKRGIAEGWLDRPYMSTAGKQRFLAGRGIDAGFAPFGYYPGLGVDRQQPRDIDVLFIGSLKNRHRQARLQKVLAEISAAGARVEVVDRGARGNTRIEILNRAKIVLHIHKYPWDTPWMRWVMAAANGALMVSEPLVDPAPFEPGVHYFEAPLSELPELIGRLLADPVLVQSTAARCGDVVRNKVSLRDSIETILGDFFPQGADPFGN